MKHDSLSRALLLASKKLLFNRKIIQTNMLIGICNRSENVNNNKEAFISNVLVIVHNKYGSTKSHCLKVYIVYETDNIGFIFNF